MVKKAKSETDEKRKHDETDEELERELEDSFPASDPPSATQPRPARLITRATRQNRTSGRRRIWPALVAGRATRPLVRPTPMENHLRSRAHRAIE